MVAVAKELHAPAQPALIVKLATKLRPVLAVNERWGSVVTMLFPSVQLVNVKQSFGVATRSTFAPTS